MRRTKPALLLAAAAALATVLGPVAAEKRYGPGVSDTEIRIGNTNPYSGPASSYGTIGKAIGAYFEMVNAGGGVNGRKIAFLSLDDGYSPAKTKEQIRKLVEREKVALIFQPLGTPTNSAVHRYLNDQQVPHLFLATGATKWGDPQGFPWTMGWQPTYQTEGVIFAKHLLDTRPDAKVAILYQNDDYGKDYVKGFKDGLGEAAARMIVAEETYEPTEPTVDSQVVNLKASGADTFFNVAIPKFAAQAIRKAHDIGWQPLHLLNSVSNSIAATLKPAGLEKAQGIVSTLYLKDPTDPAWHDDPEYRDWLAWMNRWYPAGDKDNVLNVYAYAVSRTLVKVLEQCADDLTRENIMRQAANLKNVRVEMLLPGLTINTSPNDYFPLEAMQLQRFDGTGWIRFGEIISAEGS